MTMGKGIGFCVLATAGVLLGIANDIALSEELVPYEIVDEHSIPQSLTGAPGDPDAGREVFLNRKQGNCLGCHAVTELQNELFHGEVGPSLDGVADR